MQKDTEKSLAFLSVASVAVDALVILFLTVSVTQAAQDGLFGRMIASQPDWVYLLMFPFLAISYFLAVEVVLGGRTLGRLATGLVIKDTNQDSTAALSRRLKRLAVASATGGVRSVRLGERPGYDRKPECCLYSDWVGGVSVPGKARVKPQAHAKSKGTGSMLVVETGPDRGAHIYIDQVLGVGADGIVVIGRDRSVSQLALPNDNKVSRAHCRFARRSGRHVLIDGLGAQRPSTHGTFLKGTRLASDKPVDLTSGSAFVVGDNTVRFHA